MRKANIWSWNQKLEWLYRGPVLHRRNKALVYWDRIETQYNDLESFEYISMISRASRRRYQSSVCPKWKERALALKVAWDSTAMGWKCTSWWGPFILLLYDGQRGLLRRPADRAEDDRLLLMLFFWPGDNPWWLKNCKRKLRNLFGSEPYSGRSSSSKPPCSKTELKRCTTTLCYYSHGTALHYPIIGSIHSNKQSWQRHSLGTYMPLSLSNSL